MGVNREQTLGQLKRLGIFTTVVEAGSFSGAAEQLGLSRSKVSENVSALEQALGVRLFQRSTRKLRITVEGEQLYQQTASLLPEAQTAMSAVRSSSVDLKGPLRISAAYNIAHWLLTPFLVEFNQRYPEIELCLDIQDHAVDLLQTPVDIAIRGGIPKDSSLVGQCLMPLPLQLVASEQYLATAGVPQTPDDLKHHHGIAFEQLAAIGELTLTNNQGDEQPVLLNWSHRSNSTAGVAMLVEQGFGMGFVPQKLAASYPAKLKVVLPDWRYQKLSLMLLYPSRQSLPARTRAFIDHFKDWLKRLD